MGQLHLKRVSGPIDHIPTLDGWRGIAILLVLFDHVSHAALHGFPWTTTGRHGVTLFFVLSGYLITATLLSQPINLKKFYVRRFFRLMPTAWVFLATMLLVDWVLGLHLTSWNEVRGCLFFYRNLQNPDTVGGGVAAPFWSLSIEEQFYLVWPCLLLLFGARRCRWIAGTGAVAVAIYRYAFWSRYQEGWLWAHTEVRADSLLIGCLLALLLADPTTRQRVARLSRWLAAPAAVGFIFGVCRYHFLQPLWESSAIAILLAFTSLHPNAFPGRILEWKSLAWLGTVSYSLYIWQFVFMLFPRGAALTISLCAGLPYCVLCSYYVVERPMRRFGRRLTEPSDRQSAYSVPEIVADNP